MCTPRGSVPPPSHSKLWKRASETCLHYINVHAPGSPRRRTRICTQASIRTCRICPTKNPSHTNKETNIDHPCLAARPVLPVAERMASTRHAYMHACIHAEQNTRSFTCICCAHWPKVLTIIVATRCDRLQVVIVVASLPAGEINEHTTTKKRSPAQRHLAPCPKTSYNPYNAILTSQQ